MKNKVLNSLGPDKMIQYMLSRCSFITNFPLLHCSQILLAAYLLRTSLNHKLHIILYSKLSWVPNGYIAGPPKRIGTCGLVPTNFWQICKYKLLVLFQSDYASTHKGLSPSNFLKLQRRCIVPDRVTACNNVRSLNIILSPMWSQSLQIQSFFL